MSVYTAAQDVRKKQNIQDVNAGENWQTGLDPDQFITPERYNINTQGFTTGTNYLGMKAPQLNTGQSDQARMQQMALAAALQGQAAGTAPSIAQAQLQQGTDANIAQQMAMAKSGMGGALAQRNAMQNAAGAQQTMAGQAGLARLQEQQQAQQLLANQLQGIRGQDLTGAQANLGAQTQIMNTGMGLTQQQNAANQSALINAQQLGLQEVQGANQANLGAFNTIQGREAQTAGAGWGAVGGVLGGIAGLFSDEDVKKNIKDPKKKMSEFLNKIDAHEYEYKDEKMGKGKFVSPMAQELEKSDLGTGMVIDTPKGKMVDYSRALGLMLASQGYLNKRLDKLEGKKHG